MRELNDAAVRASVGLSRAAVARLAGVSHGLVSLYEISHDAVGGRFPEKRDAIQWVYDELRRIAARAPGLRDA